MIGKAEVLERMDLEHGRDGPSDARKKRKAFDRQLELGERTEDAPFCVAAVEESTENDGKEDSEQNREVAYDGEDSQKGPSQGGNLSVTVEASIQEIRQNVEQFTQQVSGLLEAVKNFFQEASNAFEERLVLFHQSQIEKWEEEIQLLGTIDSINEEMSCRLTNAQALLSNVNM